MTNTFYIKLACWSFYKEGSGVHYQPGISGMISEKLSQLNKFSQKRGSLELPEPPPPPSTEIQELIMHRHGFKTLLN